MNLLHGKTALVTGASKGIGRAIAHALHCEGVHLKLLARTKPDVPGDFVACDFADLANVPAAVRRLGDVDFLVNNAGMFLERAVPEVSLDEWERVLRVNLTATFLVTRELLPAMIVRKEGRVVFIASTASMQGYLHQAAYVASKHGMLGFARSLALELKLHNIHVHSLCPGGVDTELIKGTQLGARLAGRAMIAPDDIAEMVVFLLKQPGNIDLTEMVVRRFDPS